MARVLIINDSNGHTWAVPLTESNVDAFWRDLEAAQPGEYESPPPGATFDEKVDALPTGRSNGGFVEVCDPNTTDWPGLNPFE